MYWLEALSLKLLGVHVWALRLVPAAHAGLMLAALYLAARRMAGEMVARRAVWVLGSSLAFLVGGQYVNHDMLVATWIGVAIWSFALALSASAVPTVNDAWLARLGFVACALGVLSKGLIGLALPGLVLLVWLLWTGQLRKILRLPWLSGLLLFGVIALPWFALEQRQFPGMLNYIVGIQQVARYTGTGFNNAQPVWFYLLCLLILLGPWLVFALYQGLTARTVQARSEAASLSPWVALCWIWVIAIVGFFSIPQSKLIGYVLPVVPPLALLAALGYGRCLAGRRGQRGLFAALVTLGLFVGVVATGAAGRYSVARSTASLAQVLACQAGADATLYAVDDFPYDLPFYVQLPQPMVVVQDWPLQRREGGDNWRREMWEGADFDPLAARSLQEPIALQQAQQQPQSWVISRPATAPTGFVLAAKTADWALWRNALAAKSPEAAEQKGLPGCRNLGR